MLLGDQSHITWPLVDSLPLDIIISKFGNALFMDYEIVQLSDIDMSRLKLVKESTSCINGRDHSRWVFRDKFSAADSSLHSRYLKIWNQNHVRRDNVLEAIKAGFYDESTASALAALIFHKGVCRGYITDACKLTYRRDNEFYEILKKKTTACDYFAIQFSRYHAGIYNGKYSLIDLEGVHPIQDLPEMPTLHSFFDDNDYGRFVMSRFLTLYPSRRDELDKQRYLLSDSWKTSLRRIPDSIYAIRILQVWRSRIQQSMRIGWRPTHTHLIEF